MAEYSMDWPNKFCFPVLGLVRELLGLKPFS